jgi:hypothetical protein
MSSDTPRSILNNLSEQFGISHGRSGMVSIGDRAFPASHAHLDFNHQDQSYSAEYSIPDEKGNLYNLTVYGGPRGPEGSSWEMQYDDPMDAFGRSVGHSDYSEKNPHGGLHDFVNQYGSDSPALPERADLNAHVLRGAKPGRMTVNETGRNGEYDFSTRYHDFATGDYISDRNWRDEIRTD